MKKIKSFGIMLDMSRNAVMSFSGLKKLLPILKKMGYNCVMLYTEDTYEVDGEPFFGYMRGRYTKDELRQIDAYAMGLGIELIPCIQTLAHLNAFLRWGKVGIDYDDILLVDDERTYELIDNMLSTLKSCFSSKKIHIGMDEAHMLGRGKHLDIHGYETVDSIMKRHLERVCQLAKKYDYEPLMWSDMFFRPWNNGQYHIGKCQIPEEFANALPKEVSPVYWNYYAVDQQAYGDMLHNHKQLSSKTWFAGGAWCWYGMIPFNRFTLESMLPALDACKEYGVKNIIFTMWGDDGAECSRFALLPSLLHLAEYAKGNTDINSIKAKFKRIVGIDYDEYMKLDCPNDVVPYSKGARNPSKYMLYSDLFNGFLDYTVCSGAGEKYTQFSKQLSATARKSRRYGYIFDSAAKLCDVLAVKYELGVRTRAAYKAGDMEALRSLATNEYPRVIKLIGIYARAFEKQWMAENKPHGFDVQDMRLGGLMHRIDSCRRRILDYTSGKLDAIEELEQDIIPLGEAGQSIAYNKAPTGATVNVVTHSLR